MKSLSNFLLIVTLILFFNNLLNGQNCKSRVFIKTDIDSSLIYLNHKFVGKGDVNLELEKGFYNITAREPINRWNAEVLNNIISVQGCNEYKIINLKFKNLFYLQTNPTDAFIYSGDSLIGHTPMFISTDVKNLILKKTNYKELPITLNSFDDNKIFNLNYSGEPNKVSFFKRNIFKFFIGGIVTLGAVSAYFKLKADDYFTQYQNTGDNSYLNQTRKYDLISGITFGALQINFGMLIYYFLTD